MIRHWKQKKREELENQLLQESFSLDFLSSDNEGDRDNIIIFDAENETDEQKKLTLRLALNDYINERIKANAQAQEKAKTADDSK
mmetsp:Transcript_30913/g.35308  ORF Transcript_30913/g.35308 Transcript_30913/m.35308 type:complete len:85 (-) Transcript_30913:30-284(-)